jgi:2-keto-3-deoxy-L-fuconate dehydrogenase
MSQGLTPPFRLDGKIAVVTGAASGIGRAIARRFHSQGAKVAILDLDEAGADAVARELDADGTSACAVACDVTARGSVEAALKSAADHLGGISILVNNAGIGHVGNLEETGDEDFDRLFSVNVRGVYLCSQLAMTYLKESRGVICNLASIASLIGVADRFAYSMTKGAVLTMTKSIAIDYLADGIRCNCVCPARIHTPFVDDYLQKNYPGREREMFDKLAAWQPLGRMGTTQEVADLVLFLCSDEAGFLTGQAVPLDGGKLVF